MWSALALVLAGCGSDAGLNITNPTSCGGGDGPEIRGVVQMPRGRVAAADSLWQRVAAAVVAPVEAISANISPVGGGVTVELVQLRPENVADDSDPGVLESVRTNNNGEFCIGLREGTDVNICRYMLQVGNRGDRTLTRAFVYSSADSINIDYLSESTVRVIVADVPPAGLCDFEPDEIRTIRQAVVDAPGTVSANNVEELNAIAASIAAADPGVRAAVLDGADLPPPPPPTDTPPPPAATPTGPTRTATQVRATATHTQTGPSPTRSSGRATRTPQGGTTPSPTLTRTTAPTRTATAGGPTNTVAAATATRPPATSTVPAATNTVGAATATRPPATNTPPGATATRPPATTAPVLTATPTPSPTAGTPAAGLGERVFTIRMDSMFPGANPRSAFFSSGLVGQSVSDRFGGGPLTLVAGSPDANGVAPLTLKQDVYFFANIPGGNNQLCFRLLAAGSSGMIDCNGGTVAGVRREQATGADPPPATNVTGVGPDSGAGAAQLRVQFAIAEQDPGTACDASATFPTSDDVIFTTGAAAGLKGTQFLTRPGENFVCANWTTTDGPGMLAVAVLAFDERASGDVVNILRIADM